MLSPTPQQPQFKCDYCERDVALKRKKNVWSAHAANFRAVVERVLESEVKRDIKLCESCMHNIEKCCTQWEDMIGKTGRFTSCEPKKRRVSTHLTGSTLTKESVGTQVDVKGLQMDHGSQTDSEITSSQKDEQSDSRFKEQLVENCLKERGDVLSIREPSVMKLAAGSLVSKENREKIQKITPLTIADEIEKTAPTLFLALMTFLKGSHAWPEQVLTTEDRKKIGAVCAVMMKSANRNMAVYAAQTALFMHTNSATNETIDMLQLFGMTVSMKSVSRILNAESNHYDALAVYIKQLREASSGPQNVLGLEKYPHYYMGETQAGHQIVGNKSGGMCIKNGSVSGSPVINAVLQFMYDNLDRIVFPKIGGVEHKTKEIHVTHIIGKGQEIFAPKEMSRTSPIEDPSTFTANKVLPQKDDVEVLIKNLSPQLEVDACKWLPSYKPFHKWASAHIPHRHSEDMQNATVIVPLGVQNKNCGKISDVVDVLETIAEQWVEEDKETGKCATVLVNGDQVAVERMEGAKKAKANEPDSKVHFAMTGYGGWHLIVLALKRLMQMVHDADNNEERGTYTFACHHIGNPEAASKDLPKKFDKVWDMVMLLLQVYFVAGFRDFCAKAGLPGDLDDPTAFIDQDKCDSPLTTKKEFLRHIRYRIGGFLKTTLGLKEENLHDAKRCVICDTHWSTIASLKRHLRIKHKVINSEGSSEAEDGVFNYTRNFMVLALLIREYESAIRAGDADRQENSLKFLLLFFRRTNSNNYVRLILKILVDNKIGRPAHEWYEARWNMTVNLGGGTGVRKACDWVVELFNKYLTKATKYNITYDNLARQAAALTYTTSVKQCFIRGSKGIDKKTQAGEAERRVASFNELLKMVTPLDLFSCKGRAGFPRVAKMHSNVFFDFNQEEDIAAYTEKYIAKAVQKLSKTQFLSHQLQESDSEEYSSGDEDLAV